MWQVDTMFEDYVDVIEAGKKLRIHPETVKRLIGQGTIPATKFSNKWLIADGLRQREIGLEAWIEEQDERCKTGFAYADIRHR